MSCFVVGDRVKLSRLAEEQGICPHVVRRRPAGVFGTVTRVTRRGTIHVAIDNTRARVGCEYHPSFWQLANEKHTATEAEIAYEDEEADICLTPWGRNDR